jgi:ribosomal protein S18 acetylase RimI-like enzyme
LLRALISRVDADHPRSDRSSVPTRKRRVTLDVAVDNPAAQRLYERIGFVVTDERVSTISNSHATEPSERRMILE